MAEKPIHKEFEQIVDEKYQLENLINMDDLREILEDFHKIAPFPIAVLNLKGEVLLESHWEPICTQFHRVNPKTAAICAESDTHFNTELVNGNERHILYRCGNGLYDAASPIIIEGQHLGNLFIGQFLLEPPDKGFFRKQAQRYGFEEEKYLEALSRLPVISEHDLKNRLDYLCGFAEFLGTVGLKEFQRDRAEEALRESEDKFRSFAEQSLVGIYLISDDVFKYVNPKFAEIFGYSVDECLDNMHFPQLVHPEDLATVEKQVGRRLSEETKSVRYSFRGIKKSGETIHVEIFGSSMVLKGKTVATGTMLDITESKHAQEAMLNQTYFLQKAQEIGQIGTWELDIKKNELLWTDENYRIFGVPIGMKLTYEIFLNCVHPDDREYVDKEWKAAFDKKPYDIEHRLLIDGKVKWVREKAELHFNEKDECIRGTGVTQDVTERKQAEEALRESKKQLSIRNRIADIFLTTPDDEMYGEVLRVVLESMESPYGTFAYIDENGDRLVPSMTRDIWDECKMPDKGIFFPRDTWGNALWARCLREKKSFTSNGPFNIPDGHMPIGRALATPIIHKGESIGNLMVGDKPTDYSKKDIELLEAIADHIAPILRVRLLNERHEAQRKRAQEEKAELESRLQRAQKMEAIGTLAGGVAHDLNNILGGLVSYPELLLLQLPDDSPLRNSILTIQKSGEKAAAVVQDLLTLARRGVVITEVVNLNHVVAEYLKSPEHEKLKSFHPTVHIETHIEKDTLNILGSSTHLSKTIMNLISNAAEAMPEGGKLTVSTENRYIDRPIKGYDNVKEGDYVVFTISDTGIGISPEDMGKIFEPFYTKKKMGRSGTGLGMAVVWGTVKDHNGYIDVQSTEGRGTTFTLYFPVTRKSVEEKSEISLRDFMGKGEAILVVDDVEEQRKIASGMLKELGYSVVSVSSGEEAVEYLKANKVDLLVLDMIMDPGMDGLDTYKKILEIHHGQKAIIASGFSETDRVKEAQSLGAITYVRKPFLLEKIGLAVKEELEK